MRGAGLVVLSALLYAVGNVFSKSLYNHQLSQVTVFLFRAVLTFFINGLLAQSCEERSAAQSCHLSLA